MNEVGSGKVLDILTDSKEPGGIIEEVVDHYGPVAAYACFSGGHDSLVSTHWAMSNIPGCKVLHCNTGIGVEATREYVRETCREYGWELVEKVQSGYYDQYVMANGFPGPPEHPKMYQRLKERSIREACKEAKSGHSRYSKVLFVSGIHQGESLIRAAYDRPASRVGGQVWVNPFYYAMPGEFDDYRDRQSLPLNDVKLKIGMSGECACGAFAKPGELELWGTVCPRLVERIKDLEKRARAKGFDWGWDEPVPAWVSDLKKGQLRMDFQPLCTACNKRDELEDLRQAGFNVG